MRFYEYEAKELFKKKEINVPSGRLIRSKEELKDAYPDFESGAVLKSQVLTGGRGKAGGIKFPGNISEAENMAGELLDGDIKGFKVHKILLEERLKIEKEYYLGFTIDRSRGCIAGIFSTKGGMDIEESARKYPEQISKINIDISEGLPPFRAREFLNRGGLKGKELLKVSEVALKLYTLFTSYDARTLEINPLVLTPEGELTAGDGKLDVDNEALGDHPQLRQEDEYLTELEREARKYNLGYVEMDGDIGVIGNGAGLNITTLDILRYYGGKPANFLEVSGRTYMLAEKALEIVLKNPNVKAVLGNFFGSISRCDVIARGLKEAIEKGKLTKPMVVSMRGNGAEEGNKILREAGIKTYENDRRAGKKIVQIAKGGE